MKLNYKLGFLLLAMISFISLPIFAGDDFKDLKDSIEDMLKNESGTSTQKENLVRKLSTYPSAETVEFCFKILKFKDKNAKSLERDIAELESKIETLRQEVKATEERSQKTGGLTQDEYQRYLENKKTITKYQNQILGLEDKLNSMSAAKTAVIYVLGKMDSSDARTAMLEGLDDKDWKVVYATIQGFGEQKWEGAFDKIAQHYPVDGKPSKYDLVRKAAIVAMRAINQKKALKNLIVALNDENSIIRHQAIIGLGQIGEKECIMPLIDQMEKESGRLLNDIITILANLTDKGFKNDAAQWRAWWNANKNKFELLKVDDVLKKAAREEGSHDTTDKFYGLEIDTNHPIFIIDQSGSMQAAADMNIALKQAQEWAKQNPGQPIPPLPPPAGRLSKWQVLQRELEKVINGLDTKEADFNIVWYSTDVEVYNKDGMVKASTKEKDKATKEIKSRQANGFTNIYDALEKAFQIASGKKEKGESEWTGKGEAQKLADTFFFMTDGSPDDGDHNSVSPKEDLNNILKKVKEWNKGLNIKIHTIGVGNCAEQFLAQLAAQNNGTFKHHKTDKEEK